MTEPPGSNADPDQTPPHGTIYRDEWRHVGRVSYESTSFVRTREFRLVALGVVSALVTVYVVGLLM